LRFLIRVTLRRLDLATEIYHIREPQKISLVMSPAQTKRLPAVASSLKARILLSLSSGCGLRAGEVVRLKVKHIDSAQKIIRIEQSKGRKDRNVMPRRPQGQPTAVLRPAGPSRRAKGLRGLFGAVAQDRVVPLLKVAVRRTRGGARLSVALYPPRRHRQQPAHRLQRERRHLQVQGLSCRRPRPLQDDDARHRRVHPPLPRPHSAARLPPHPTLWPVRQWQPCGQYHTRPRFARRAISPKTTRDTRGHSRSRPAAHVVASMSLLRRPDDHHRDLREGLPREKQPHTGSASDQDRYLMTLLPRTDNRPDTLAATSSPAMLKLVAAA